MRSRLATVVVAIAALGLIVGAPVALAKTSKTDKSQTNAIKKQSKSIKSLGKSTKTLGKSTKSAASAIAALKVIADRGDKNASTVLAAAPAIIQGLTDLKTGLTAAGAGLTGLQTLVNSQEYGYVQPDIGGTQTGFIVTPDIPDSVEQAQAEQQFVAGGTGTISTQYGVRSNESDAASCGVTIIDVTAKTTATQAPTAVTAKATLAATGASPFALIGGTDQPQTGPTLAVTSGDVYSVKLNCVDTTPPSSTDPSN